MNLRLIAAFALAALLLTGCSVYVRDDEGVKVAVGGDMIKVDVNDKTGVDVKVPGVQVSVPAGGAQGDANPGSVPVSETLPAAAKSLDLRLSLPMGTLRLDGAGSNAVTGQVGYVKTAPAISSRLSGDRFTVEISRESGPVSVSGNVRIPDTVLHVGTKLPVTLDLEVSMGEVRLDLRELNVTRVKATARMGDLVVNLPAGANVRLKLNQALGSNNLSSAGFTKSGDAWVSPGFKSENVIELDLQVNMGTVTVLR